MIDCQTVRHLLDCLAAPERAVDEGVVGHLANCPDCQKFADRRQAFDRRVSSQLKAVPIPVGLLEKLLTETAADFPQRVTASGSRKSIFSGRLNRMTAVSVLAGLLLMAFMLVVSQPDSIAKLDYAESKIQLIRQLSQLDAADWNSLPAFDGSQIQLGRLDSVLNKWSLSDPIGLDLGRGPEHEVAVFDFSFQKWSGKLVVLPSEFFEGVPQQELPDSSSGLQVLEWHPAGSTLTYLCFVELGSAEELSQMMFGAIG